MSLMFRKPWLHIKGMNLSRTYLLHAVNSPPNSILLFLRVIQFLARNFMENPKYYDISMKFNIVPPDSKLESLRNLNLVRDIISSVCNLYVITLCELIA